MKRGAPLQRKTQLKRQTIRYLKSSEPRPEGEPRRYTSDKRGYVRLRWKIGPGEYVETYERDDSNRLVGRPIPKRIDLPEAVRLLSTGMTQRDVALQLGVDHGALSRALRREGVSTRRTVRASFVEPDPQRVVQLYVDEHRGMQQIARLLDCSPDVVRRVLLAQKITIRRVGVPSGDHHPTRKTHVEYETEFKRWRARIRRRSGGRCEGRVLDVCIGKAQHVHHRKLRGQGGQNDEATLIDLCEPCHRWAHANPVAARERRLIVPSWADVTSDEWKNPAL